MPARLLFLPVSLLGRMTLNWSWGPVTQGHKGEEECNILSCHHNKNRQKKSSNGAVPVTTAKMGFPSLAVVSMGQGVKVTLLNGTTGFFFFYSLHHNRKLTTEIEDKNTQDISH